MDLRIKKTYLLLHNAFTQLLEEKRFEDFTVNELCDRAMIRRATFYKHFADKYEYYTFYLREICETFNDQLAPDVEVNEVNAYSLHMCRELLRFVKKHERLVKNALDSSMFPTLLSILLEQIRSDTLHILRRVNGTNNLTELQMEGMAAFFSGGVLSTLFRFLKSGIQINEDQFIEIVSEFLIPSEMTSQRRNK